MKTIVMDLDGTLTLEQEGVSHEDAAARQKEIEKIREYAKLGFRVAIYTSRNMRIICTLYR